MSEAFDSYETAYAKARTSATKIGVDFGIEKTKEYGRQVFVVRMLPRPENCSGFEMRCQRVRPGE